MINAGENKQSRAGRYVLQPAGYRAFIPAPLPPDPPLDLAGPLRALLSEADYALGRLDGAILTLPNPDLFVFMYVRKEAVFSSQIEGTQSSLQNLLAAEARLHDPDAPADVSEVVNYVKAMNHGLARLTELPVSVRLIREIHAELMRGVAEVAIEAAQTAAAILRMREDYRAHCGKAGPRRRQRSPHLRKTLRSPHRDGGHGARVALHHAGWRKPARQPARGRGRPARDHRLRPQPPLPLRSLPAALRGTGRGAGMTRKRESSVARNKQAEAAKLDAAIARNLQELGFWENPR